MTAILKLAMCLALTGAQAVNDHMATGNEKLYVIECDEGFKTPDSKDGHHFHVFAEVER